MNKQEPEQTQENLRKLLEQHWEHCRHLEGERAQFTQVYAAIITGFFVGYSYLVSDGTTIPEYIVWPILLFLVALTFIGCFLTLRWAYSFECHRKRINEIAIILWLSCNVVVPLDPTMEIPPFRTTPPGSRKVKVDEVFRTRYLFPLFYSLVLIGILVLIGCHLYSCLKDIKLPHHEILAVSIPIILIIPVSILIFIFIYRRFDSIRKLNTEKRVILVGCNGEWAQKCYLPFLIEKAARGDITLWAIDLQSEIKLDFPGSRSLWQIAEGKGKACYMDVTKSVESYEIPWNVDYVFVVTPDRCHCEVAEFWLSRLSPNGKVFIEKPLDASIVAAEQLKGKILNNNIVYGFDHYLASLYPFLHCEPQDLAKIGDIKSLEINILENNVIPPHRVQTLKKGVIFDLFPHVLAVSAAVVEKKLAPTEAILQNAEFKKGARAKYRGWHFSSETFACIEFLIGNKMVTARVGKGIGKTPKKRMVVRGTHGRKRKFDFNNDNSSVNAKRRDLESKHVESFLEAVLAGCSMDSVPGVLSFGAAFEILKWLSDTRGKINMGPDYNVGVALRLLCTSLCSPFLRPSGVARETRAGD